jgi:hypothetical protein
MKTKTEFLLLAFALWLISFQGYAINSPGEWKPIAMPAIPHTKALYALDNHIDSVIILNEHDTTRLEFSFNSNGSLAEKTEQKLIGTSWVNSALSVYTYYGDGKLNTLTEKVWMNANWENIQQTIHYYDDNGHNDVILKKDWINNAWVDFEMKEMTYDSLSGALLSTLTKNWDSAAWINVYLCNYAYDGNGNVAEEQMSNYENNAWENAVKIFYTYDLNNHMLTMQHLFWIDGDWTNATYFNYEWDMNGNCESWLRLIWDGTAWVNANLSLLTYDQYGNCTERINQSWFNNTWENSTKCTYSYAAGHIKGNAFGWDGIWVPAAFNIEIGHYQDGGQNSLFSGWGMQIDYYCHDLTTGTATIESDQTGALSIYPNPAADIVTVDYMLPETDYVIIQLYSITGQWLTCLYTGNAGPGVLTIPVRLTDFPCGLYLLEMSNSKAKLCRKLNIVK